MTDSEGATKVTYEVWGQSPCCKPFVRHVNDDEQQCRERYERLLCVFPHVSFSLVKRTMETLEEREGVTQ
ncbi:MAG: hypothetical protein LC793_24025 [Thermomicrobia bacterium]|nr:hypothetical protein [Thermomicrobia bacterium]